MLRRQSWALHSGRWPGACATRAMPRAGSGCGTSWLPANLPGCHPLRKGSAGTLGELSPKPHPWLYAEVARVGLGFGTNENGHIIGIEDSSAGVCSIRLANIPVIGITEGNIEQSGTLGLCHHYCSDFNQILDIIGG